MIFEIILALIIGILAGTLTGLIPGLHVNLLALILLSLIPKFPNLSILPLVTFIISMSITHTVNNTIPAIFLGAPEEDTFLSILPGHKLLLEGKGYEAIILTIYGSLLALLLIIIISPVYILILPSIYSSIKLLIPYILIFISIYLILREEKPLTSIIVFLLAGLLGILTFNLPINEPLMPLLTGLFGLSALTISIKNKINLPKQIISPLNKIKISKTEFKKTTLAAILSAPICSFLPGIGAGHAALISSETIPQTNRSFLILLGSLNTIVMGLSFVTIYSINKARSGSAMAVQKILESFTLSNLIFFIFIILISGIISAIIAIKLTKIFSKILNKINYNILSIIISIFLIILTYIVSSSIGILILATASSLGIYCISTNTRRINLMGSLIIPTIIFYLTI
ncbi:hypothetical protein COU54_04700 [Candidatus Pacearchaeota archaeon CG10_big_fil_rev_8_21_14_0_10_31_24]|nr:MAG: hypothetical protein COU54_04700 [Candidatus Pacearchaeota archaeon CG10_big_fil_rev_8_21_14_0_10_31_24]